MKHRRRGEDKVYSDYGEHVLRSIERELLEPGNVFIPEAEDWPDDAAIIDAIEKYGTAGEAKYFSVEPMRPAPLCALRQVAKTALPRPGARLVR